MKKDNRGLSLVEVIIVVTILSLVAGGAYLGVGVISGKNAEKCAKFIQAAFQDTRITTMGKTQAYLDIYRDRNGNVCIKEVEVDGAGISTESVKEIGDDTVMVYYKFEGESGYTAIGSEANPLRISFNRSSGALEAISGKNCVEIKVVRGSRESILQIAYLTGRIELQ